MLGLTIINAAINRYKDLCEGKYCGQSVSRVQTILGVDFFYSPPPRSAVPYAASLKCDGSQIGMLGSSDPLVKRQMQNQGARRQRQSTLTGGMTWKSKLMSDRCDDSTAWRSCARNTGSEEATWGASREVEVESPQKPAIMPKSPYCEKDLGLFEVPNQSYDANSGRLLTISSNANKMPGHQTSGCNPCPPPGYQLFSPAPHILYGYSLPTVNTLQGVNVATVCGNYNPAMAFGNDQQTGRSTAGPPFHRGALVVPTYGDFAGKVRIIEIVHMVSMSIHCALSNII